MLRIDDFILYIPLKGNTTDYSLNGYSVTNDSVTATTDEYGISNQAYEWSATTDNLTYSSTVANAIATQMNSTAGCTIRGKFNFTTLASNASGRVVSNYGGSGVRSFAFSIINGLGLNTDSFVAVSSDDGAGLTVANSSASTLTYSSFKEYKVTSIQATGTTNDFDVYWDGSNVINVTQENCYTSSTHGFDIGQQTHSTTADGFIGKANNIMVFKKITNSLEDKFIQKFGNMKRVA